MIRQLLDAQIFLFSFHFLFDGFIFGKKQAIIPNNGNNVLILKTNSILVSSANQPKKADPIPPSPNINPKNIPCVSVYHTDNSAAVKDDYPVGNIVENVTEPFSVIIR